MGSAAGYERIAVTPIAGALGAEIAGVDLTRALDNRTADEIHRAFREHLVVFFRDQKVSPADLKAFGRLFGPLGRIDFVRSLVQEHPEVMVITREPAPSKPEINFGNAWHSDMSYAPEPPLGTALHAQALPPVGGDTMWTNMYLAYETLSEGMRRTLDGLKAVHSAVRAYGPQGAIVTDDDGRADAGGMVIRSGPEALVEREHPVVRTHPQTGRKALFINPVYTLRFAGMTADESAPLLKFLYQHATRPEFTCRFRWSDNALALWDNRCAMHFAINDYLGHRRVMHRITIAGERPV